MNLDYDYMDDVEARYQGYDTVEDYDFANGFTVTEHERKTEAREAPEKDNNEAESRVPGAGDSTDDDDIPANPNTCENVCVVYSKYRLVLLE